MSLLKQFSLIIVLSLLCACSVNYHSIAPNSRDRKTDTREYATNTPLTVAIPNWIVNIPDGNNHIIGISYKSSSIDNMINAAREMATVQYARNLSSYNIDKYVQFDRTYTEMEYYDNRSFNFQVSDPKQLWKIYDHLHLVDYYILHNIYFFALFNFDESKKASIPEVDISKEFTGDNVTCPGNPPEWFNEENVYPEGKYIYSRTTARSSSLIDAWNEATQKARLLQSSYYSTVVQSLTQSEFANSSERIHRATAVETVYHLKNIEMSRCHIQGEYRDNNIRYTVFIELKIQNYK